MSTWRPVYWQFICFSVLYSIQITTAAATSVPAYINEGCFASTPVDVFPSKRLPSSTGPDQCRSYLSTRDDKIYATRICLQSKAHCMISEVDPKDLSPSIVMEKSFDMTSSTYQMHSNSAAAIVVLSHYQGNWVFAVFKIPQLSMKYTKVHKWMDNAEEISLTESQNYYYVLYTKSTAAGATRYLMPIDKTNGDSKWKSPANVTYFAPLEGEVMHSMLIREDASHFVVYWEIKTAGVPALFVRSISFEGKDSNEISLAEDSSNLGSYDLNAVGHLDGQGYVIYSLKTPNGARFILYQKDGMSQPTIIQGSAYLDKDPSEPHYVGAYNIATMHGSKLLLLYRQQAGNTAHISYMIFNSDGTNYASQFGELVSGEVIEIEAVTDSSNRFYFLMGVKNGDQEHYYIGEVTSLD